MSIVPTGFVTCLAQLLQSAPDSYSSSQFSLSERGTVQLTDDAETIFTKMRVE